MSRLYIHEQEGFGQVVRAVYGSGYMDYECALMSWETYTFLLRLGIAQEPITPMNYRVLYGTLGHGYVTGDEIPPEVSLLPERLPVAVKSCKINTSELGRLVEWPHVPYIWSSAYLVPTLVQLGLVENELPVGIHVDIPSHPVPTGTGAYYFEY